MSDLKDKPTFWLYKVESFLYIKSYIVHCKRDGQHGISTLRFRQIPYLEEVAKKYVDIFIKKKL